MKRFIAVFCFLILLYSPGNAYAGDFSPGNAYAGDLTILSEEWPPVSFSENNRPDGLGVEVVRDILRRVQTRDNIGIVPWARGWRMATEFPDVVLFTMTRTPEREKLFTLIGPVAAGTTAFYAKKGRNIAIRNLDDARQVRRIGVYRTSVEEQILDEQGFRNLDETAMPLHCAKKLMVDRIDLWCNANLTAGKILEEAGYSIADVENVYTLQENLLYIAFSKGTSAAVIEKWEKALKDCKADGTFARIYQKWLPGEKPPENTERIGISPQ